MYFSASHSSNDPFRNYSGQYDQKIKETPLLCFSGFAHTLSFYTWNLYQGVRIIQQKVSPPVAAEAQKSICESLHIS